MDADLFGGSGFQSMSISEVIIMLRSVCCVLTMCGQVYGEFSKLLCVI